TALGIGCVLVAGFEDSRVKEALGLPSGLEPAALLCIGQHVPCGRVTVSVGVSAISDQQYPDVTALFKAADTALYRAKSDQRNCVRVAAGLVGRGGKPETGLVHHSRSGGSL
ncbi:MAG: diguanylate cyclase, partial [Marinobacter sp.]|nr:diguanylate cyclase [Marinobacter sp.]